MTAFHRTSVVLAITCCLVNPVAADEFGNFTYVDEGSTITITDYPVDAVGAVAIPSSIVGKPVTAIGYKAFEDCATITSVTIPNTVTTLGSYAFSNCAGITTVTIPNSVNSIGENAFAQCVGLTSVRIPDGVTLIEGSTFEGCDALTSVAIPSSVTEIASFAFSDCGALAEIIIPASVTVMGGNVFDVCVNLKYAFFMGNAPAMGSVVFPDQDSNPNLRIYYFTGKAGFAAEYWQPEGYDIFYKTVEMGAVNSFAPWLILQELPVTSDPYSDANGDGVNLLMACALNLDPNNNLSGSLPQAAFTGNTMSMSFYAGAYGITYSVETSDELTDWSATGVTLSEMDGNQIRTATVAPSGSKRFMRLVVRN